ncbi:MAG: hypothetical protein AMK73_09255, partial [Planctomycetes bacterium SM23_32]
MRPSFVLMMAATCAWWGAAAHAAVERTSEAVVIRTDACSLAFSTADGSILWLRQAGSSEPILRSGEHGLWRAGFRDGRQAAAAGTGAGQAFRIEEGADGVLMTFGGSEVAVRLTVTPRPDGVDFSAELTPRRGTVLEFDLPAKLRFEPEQVERLVFPMDGSVSVGVAFKRDFFERQPEEEPCGWDARPAGPSGYAALYGGPLEQRAEGDLPVALRVTPEGRDWLGPELADRVAAAEAVVNRPPTP